MPDKLIKELARSKNKKQAEILQRFFKTGKGEYGEGDVFWGIKVPAQRKIAQKYWQKTNLNEIEKLLKSKIHEHRLTGLIILIEKYSKEKRENKKTYFNFYLKNISGVNNWDLVDLSAPAIVGDFLLDKEKDILYKLAKSKNLWERRIAIISTFSFIRCNKFEDVLKISQMLLKDEHDLIHKAVGWMLREIGKRDKKTLERFLEENCKDMPGTMIRYSIEKFEKKQRNKWLLKRAGRKKRSTKKVF